MVDARFRPIEAPSGKYLNSVNLSFMDIDPESGNSVLYHGSGYLFSPHLIFTAGHNLTGQTLGSTITLKFGYTSDNNAQPVNNVYYNHAINSSDRVTANPDIAWLKSTQTLPFQDLGANKPGIISYVGNTVPNKLLGLQATSFGYPQAPQGAIDATHIPGQTLYEVSGTLASYDSKVFLVQGMANYGGQSGSPIFVDYQNKSWLVGVLSNGDLQSDKTISNNTYGTKIVGDVFNSVVGIIKSDYSDWHDAPKMMIFGADRPTNRSEIEIKSTFSSDTVYSGQGDHQIYASTGDDLFITEAIGKSVVDYSDSFDSQQIKIKEISVADGKAIALEKNINGSVAGHDNFDGSFEIKLAANNGAVKFISGSDDGIATTSSQQKIILDANADSAAAQKTLNFSLFDHALLSDADKVTSVNTQFASTSNLSSLEFKNFETIYGTANGDNVSLGAGIKTFEAGNGENVVKANLASGVNIFGGTGNDTIVGNGTNGYLDGGRGGNDHFFGSSNGTDNFVFSGGQLEITGADALDKLYFRSDVIRTSSTDPLAQSTDQGIQIKGGLGEVSFAGLASGTFDYSHTVTTQHPVFGTMTREVYDYKTIFANNPDGSKFDFSIDFEQVNGTDLSISFRKTVGEFIDPFSGDKFNVSENIDGKILIHDFTDGVLGIHFADIQQGPDNTGTKYDDRNAATLDYLDHGIFKVLPTDHYDAYIV